ncbi:MAG: hypothetical protein OXS30_11315 [Chloroflexota bacterium]|nr:hypothetical protein [Chloroflexota bacterium]
METKTQPMVRAGERALLFSHREYVAMRRQGQEMASYDILMRRPDDAERSDLSERERWLPVAADRYLKHRATGWCEAESPDELPGEWFAQALERDAFAEAREEIDGEEE